ncbi:DUF262 domain-containing protein [Fusobacterium ulcerans]|uniref:DUF262 domain-containing protein n=1 Tax=Fusobacterium ulcerans TaxID=861 RepID=UPI0026F1B322|nr:DUF262 domain-containing HNH endonuclease family protein [Fusobacterium ulcerans]
MIFQAQPKKVGDILSLSREYRIPRFQREYSWEKEELLQFWKDIHENILKEKDKLELREYFIGSLVLVGNDQSGEKFEIVDGQQRLTTITIIFSVLTHIFKELGQDPISEKCYSYVEGINGDGAPFFKLVNETPKPFFQRKIQHKIISDSYKANTEEEKRLEYAYNFFSEELKEEKLQNIFGKEFPYTELLKKVRAQVEALKIIYITVDSLDDAYTIFETLNAKGKDLEVIDLVKNKIFKVLASQHPSDEANDSWKKIKLNLRDREQNESISKFFRHFWLSKYEFVTSNKLYSSFLKNFSEASKDEYKDLISELEKESQNYLKILKPVKDDWKQQEEKEILDSLIALRIFRVEQVRTLILAIFNLRENKKIDLSTMKNVLRLVEKFHFIFTAICSSSASGLEAKYSYIARKLRTSKSKIEIKTILEELKLYYINKCPDEKVFFINFKEIQYTSKNTKQKKLIQYILSMFERKLITTDEIDVLNLSLEHVASESKKIENFDKIGNLLPLSQKLNVVIADKEFSEKIKELKKSELKIVQEFVKEYSTQKSWKTEDIDKRTGKLAKIAYNDIWNFK